VSASSLAPTTNIIGYRAGMRNYATPYSAEWNKPQTTRDSEIARVRAEYEKNGLLQRIIVAEVENIVGTGFRVVHRTKSREWNALATEYLTYRNSDARFAFPNLPGRSEWGVQLMACFHEALDGGMFLYRSSRGVELFDQVQCQTPWERWSDASCRDGIQFGPDGRLKGFWVGPYSKDDGRVSENDMTLIPAFTRMDDGTEFAITTYLHAGRFSSAYRSGAPLACTLDDLERLSDYYDAVTERAVCEALVVGVHKSNRLSASGSFNVGRKDSAATDTNIEAAYQLPSYMEPAAVVRIGQDEEFDIKGMTSPGNGFDPMTKMSTRMIAAPASMPLEIALLHFSDTNYAASKAAIEQFRIAMRQEKRKHADQFTRPNTELMLYEAMRDGDLPWNDEWRRFQVIPSGWRSMQELDEAQAMDLRAGSVTSFTWEMQETFGRTADDRIEDLVSEAEAIKAAAARAGLDVEDLTARFYANPFKKAVAGQEPTGTSTPEKRALNNKA